MPSSQKTPKGLNKWIGTDVLKTQDFINDNELVDQLVTALELNIARMGSELSKYRLNKDSNGVFTELQIKRTDGTLIKKSVLSGGTSPKYTTRTVTYYDTNGTTVLATLTFTQNYSGEDWVSEVRA